MHGIQCYQFDIIDSKWINRGPTFKNKIPGKNLGGGFKIQIFFLRQLFDYLVVKRLCTGVFAFMIQLFSKIKCSGKVFFLLVFYGMGS